MSTAENLVQRFNEWTPDNTELRAKVRRLEAKLTQIAIVCDDNADVSHPQLALKFIRQIADQP